MTKKKRLILIFTIIFGIATCLAIFVGWQRQPLNMISTNLKISLPTTSKVINYMYHCNGGYFETQISIENKSINFVKKELDRCFGKEKQDISRYGLFDTTVNELWNLKNEKMEHIYMRFFTVGTFTIVAHQVWAFISRTKEGQYSLYISF